MTKGAVFRVSNRNSNQPETPPYQGTVYRSAVRPRWDASPGPAPRFGYSPRPGAQGGPEKHCHSVTALKPTQPARYRIWSVLHHDVMASYWQKVLMHLISPVCVYVILWCQVPPPTNHAVLRCMSTSQCACVPHRGRAGEQPAPLQLPAPPRARQRQFVWPPKVAGTPAAHARHVTAVGGIRASR